ncbi:MAG: hypothetical protein HYS67_03755 [Deltaproteobacteria bacterium]|nr:hypothetical protein [Deltaproteobacteria bacterium]
MSPNFTWMSSSLRLWKSPPAIPVSTSIVMPWNINDYLGSGIERPALDHIGFKVESVEAFKKDLQTLVGRNPSLSPSPVGSGPEGAARLKLFQKCPYGKHQLADPDGVLIDVSD